MKLKQRYYWCLIPLFLQLFCYTYAQAERYKVGLLVVATGKYIQFVKPLLDSARTYFCPNHDVTYFIFTDGVYQSEPDVVLLPQNKLGWPYDTLMRCAMYDKYSSELVSMDYLFACDADMRFVDCVGDEILSPRVATQHPGYVGQRGTYETRPISRACIYAHEGQHYFAGGFHGGSAQEFLKLAHTMHENIKIDMSKGFIAVWHDESHLNRYFVDNPPTAILSPSYCYPESWNIKYTKRLLALDKNHAEVRA